MLKDARAKREEVKRSKAKVASTGQAKAKEESPIKAGEGSQGGGGRAVLSPSASSEAVTNIDDQQPDPGANRKINHIRKKLQHAQQNKKQQQSSAAAGKEAAQVATASKASNSGQKKKFKLTKRFKDDVVPHVAPKKRANPNQPPEDAEEAEDGDDGQEDSSDQLEQADENAKPGPEKTAAVGDLAFVAKFKLNRRTLADLCNQIETDEQKKDEENIEEAGTSDGGATTDGGRGGADGSGSDDEANGMLLQQIHGKILGVLKLDAAEPPNNKPQKPAPPKDPKAKKPTKPKAAQSAVATAAKANTQPP